MSSAGVADRFAFTRGFYAERPDVTLSWLDENGERLLSRLLRRSRVTPRHARHVAQLVAALGPGLEDVSDSGLAEMSQELRVTLRREGFQTGPVVRGFALVRELARRHLGKRPYDVQVMGGYVMLSGMIAEMETGEGKTLTATLPACIAGLAGVPVHVITVNDYLVERDAEQMGPVYRALGLSVGMVRHGLQPAQRRAEYGCDVVYCSNKEIAFDYLRDRIAMGRMRARVRFDLEQLARGRSRADDLVLRGLCFGIVDEADSVLVDEARTPLIISGGKGVDLLEEEVYQTAIDLARQLEPGIDFAVDPRERCALVSKIGADRLDELAVNLGGVWRGPHRRAELVAQALAALHMFERDKDYLLADGKVQIIDEYTGRVMPDRSWQSGLHQMIEAKEGCEITGHTEPLAQISYQRMFRRYLRLAGMTGTASEVASELWNVYRLPVVRMPTHRPIQRRSLGDRVYTSAEARWGAVVERIQSLHQAGRPVLIGTRSVSASEHLSRLLDAVGLPHRVLNARQDKEEADIVAQAGRPGCITVATNMAGRGTDIKLDPESLSAGGLHVIATERHESHRIDRQLYGRCGRQGDPGSFEAIVCLEDELVKVHGKRVGWLAKLQTSAQSDDEATVRGRVRGLVVRLAQRRAERLHAKMRRRLLKVDERASTLLAFSGRGE
jgi:preprotein translocase subunit SecA